MNMNDFLRNFEEAIDGVEPGSLTPETEFRTMDQWDSLAALTVLAMADSEYEVSISGTELKNCKTVQDIYDVVAGKTA